MELACTLLLHWDGEGTQYGHDPRRLLNTMSAEVWAIWEAFYRRYPFGPAWAGYFAAMGPWAAVNFNPFRKKGSPMVPITKFIPDLTVRPEENASEKAAATLAGLAAATGATFLDLSKPLVEPT